MSNSNLHVVIGLGATGLSCVRFLLKQQIPIVVMDTRDDPPNLAQFRNDYPTIPVYTGNDWPQTVLNQAKTLVVSPGISIAIPSIQQAKAHGAEIMGDIELFARTNQAPVIAITGSNGKSTVTTLVGEMARVAGKKVAVIGNIGTPVLDVFNEGIPAYDLVVMELSSFQLETTYSLKPVAATVLNITPDHMDRYPSLADYAKAKHRIFINAQHIIINQEDPLSKNDEISKAAKKWFFSTSAPRLNEFGLRTIEGKVWLCLGEKNLLAADKLKIVGKHNLANALSALALGTAAGLPMESMLQALTQFNGLSHRCQWVAEKEGIRWINDSKGTNIGACQAALEGIGQQLLGKIVLLLGGDGKGADFSDLSSQVVKYCRAIIVMGKDGERILAALGESIQSYAAASMQEAVKIAASMARPGDVVLLSPACSSLDQYQNFSHRGEIFMDTVKAVLGRDHVN